MLNAVSRLIKKKYILWMLITSIAFGAAAYLYNVFVVKRQVSMIIEFNYPGSEKGLNPDGSIFKTTELKSAEVIEKAKRSLSDKNTDTDFLRSRIFITSKVTDRSIERVIAAVQNEQNTVYMPTAFYVYYSQKNKFAKNESKVFMDALAKAYTEYFSKKYSEKNDVLVFNTVKYNFNSNDYLEIYTILRDKVDSMINYVKAHQNENRAFYTEDGANLGMAAKKLEAFRDNRLETFYAFIVQNGISKNNGEIAESLEYVIDENENIYERFYEGSQIIDGAIGKYDQDIAVAYVPSVDGKHNYYMSRTKTGVDYLIKQSYSSLLSATDAKKEVEDKKSIRQKFIAAEQTQGYSITAAEEMISDLCKNLKTLSDEVVKIDNEYLQHKTTNYFTVRPPQQNGLSVMAILKIMILGFLLALAAAVFFEFFEKSLVKKIRDVESVFTSVESEKKNGGE